MHTKFAGVMESIPASFERLMAMQPSYRTSISAKTLPRSGVYVFSENGVPFYVGRSNNLFQRYNQHCATFAQHNQATFAWKLMLEDPRCKNVETKGVARATLLLDTEFSAAFNAAKARVSQMGYRFVEETNQQRQTLLEAYACITLGTKYNDFDTH